MNMNHLQDLERIIQRANRPGFFRRDANGSEQEIQGYVVQLTHETFPRGSDGQRATEPTVHTEAAVVLAVSSQDAQAAAVRPYNNTHVLSVEPMHPGNNRTLFRHELSKISPVS
jgi:hypothetical protein